MPLEADREADRRHVLAEEAADHAVVATAAAERVVDGRVGELEDRAGVVAHAAHEERVEDERDLVDRRRSSRRAAPRRPPRRCRPGARRSRRARPAGRSLRICRSPYGLYSMVIGRMKNASSASTAAAVTPRSRSSATTPCGPILSSLSIVMSTPGRSSAVKPKLSSIQSSTRRSLMRTRRALEAEGVDGVERRDDELGLGAGRGIPDDVDVALHELAVAALLRALGAPHRRDLDRRGTRRQLAAVARVEPRERHREVVAQAEVGERRRGRRPPRGSRRRRGRA